MNSKLIFYVIAGFIITFLLVQQSKPSVTHTNISTESATVKPVPSDQVVPTPITTEFMDSLAQPVTDFKTRITKKPFGLYVTPKESPVTPEQFTGYHTGVDVEYEDILGNIPVVSIADGSVVRSSWVSGYGGLIAIQSVINSQTYVVIYGHLNPDNLPKVSSKIKKGQKIGTLGEGYSYETDGERRHLHLAVHVGTIVDVKGYVQNKSDLSNWIDPLSLYP